MNDGGEFNVTQVNGFWYQRTIGPVWCSIYTRAGKDHLIIRGSPSWDERHEALAHWLANVCTDEDMLAYFNRDKKTSLSQRAVADIAQGQLADAIGYL